MPEAKKEGKAKVNSAKQKGPVKTKAIKSNSPAKAKSASAAKPKVEKEAVMAKPETIKVPKVRVARGKAKQARGPKARARGGFAELIRIQSQYEEAKKGAKADLKREYEDLIKEADRIKAQYKGLFDESIESAPKAKAARAPKAPGKVQGLKPFTMKEVENFIDQKKTGAAIKIKGRRAKSIARMQEAYGESEDADDILKLLNK
jgi:hypothetical protein